MTKFAQFYAGKRVLVTGHTGFKGSWLSYWLAKMGATVGGFALAPEEEDHLYHKLELDDHVESHISDIRDPVAIQKAIKTFKPDIVFHMAAQALVRKSYHDPRTTVETNVMGGFNLLEAVQQSDSVKSLVYITSDKCYWNNEWVWGYRETDPLGGVDPYSASKACAEHIFKTFYLSYFSRRDGFGCGSTRAGNVIGGGDFSEDRIVPDIIRAVQNKKPVEIRSPRATRPWQHVLDPLCGYLTLGMSLYEKPDYHNGGAWNFGPTNKSIQTVRTLAEQIMRPWPDSVLNINEPKDKPHESTLLHLSIDKAQTLLDWEPKWQFEEATKRTADWYAQTMSGIAVRDVTEQQIEDFTKDD